MNTNILEFRLDHHGEPLAAQSIKKGHYILFKTGQNDCAGCVEVGDLLQGIWLNDQGVEVLGVARYDGPDKYQMENYKLLHSVSFLPTT